MPDGIYLANDRLQQLNGDLFEQNARQTFGDVWEQQASAAAPDLIAQAQKEADDRARAQMQLEQAQRDHMATSFEATAPSMAAQHLASLNADVAPPPQEAPQPAPAPDTAQTAPDYAAPTPAPAQSQPAPSAPVTAPMSNPAATQQPISAPAAATPTTAGISGGGDLSGRVGARGQQILSSAADAASWLGDQGQKALQAVLMTEGGLAGARGDQGKSAGPLQFYEGGQLANFAQQLGLGLEQAKRYVEQNPEAAIQWAIGTPDKPGYLGGAIQRGLQAGLQGADLATYAQRHGQVSVSPERAGQNFQAMFGGGQDVISGAGQAVADVASGAGRVVSAAVNHVIDNLRPSQFGVGLSNGEAYAACGPVAAMAFARATGRNPTAQEAVELAKRVGWTAAQGMAGPSSELDLLKSMGVASHMENGADPNKIAQDVQNGNPVIISTPGHYFVADGYNPQTGQFHVGTSGTDLRAGSEWMTLDGMQKVMGSAQATLYLDRQPGDGPSVAAQMAQAPTSPTYMGVNQPAQPQPPQPSSPIDAFKQKLGDAFSDLFAPLQNLFGGSSSTPPAPEGGGYGAVPPGGVNPLPGIVDQATQALPSILYGPTGRPPTAEEFAARAAANPTARVQYPDNPLEVLGGASLGAPTSGEQATTARNEAIAGGNPLRDVPVVGGATTFAGQAIADPTNLLLFGPGIGKAGLEAGATLAESPEVQAALRSRMRGEAEAGFAVGLPTGEIKPPGLPPNEYLPAGPQPGQLGFGTELPLGGPRPAGGEAVGPAGPQPGQLQIGSELPIGGPAPVGSELLGPGGPQRGQLQIGTELPIGGPRPTGTEPLAPGAQPGQFQFGSELPLGGARPTGTETLPAGAQRGQLQLGSELPVGGPRPAGSETLGPSGPQPGQVDLGLNAPTIHPRIQELFGDAPEYRQIAQQGLDDLVQSGANPTQIGRYFAGLERNAGVNQPELSVGGIGANDWFRALRNGAMAGGLSTLGHVFLNIPLQTVASIPREALASAFRGAPEQIPASLIGLFKGYSAGWEAASQQLRYGLSGAEAAAGDLGAVTPALRATNRVAETAYNALQGLVSTHGVAQTFMENVGFIQKLTQQAWTMAKNEGLSGSAFTNRVEQIVKNAAIDPQYSDMLVTAQQYGQRMALRGAQGTLGRGARGIAQAGPLGNLLVPFEGIAYNVVTRGIELTPAGPLGTGLDVLRKAAGYGPYAAGASKAGAAAVAPVSERLANNVLGLGLLAYGLDLATHGRVVGHGPDDPTERRAWIDQGGQPDSFVVDGQPNASGQIVGGRYVSGHLFGQFFYPFATAAAIIESQRAAQGKGDQNMTEVMADSVRRLSEYVSNETWLRSVAQITDALKTEGGAAQKLETLAANMAESFVPQTALFRNVEQATDPYVRQAAKGDLVGRLATAYPGLAGTQPIRQSLTGEPVSNPNQGVGIFAPTGRGAPDPVIQLFGNAGIGVPPPPTHVRVTSKYEMDLQPDEQRQYQDIRGQALRELTQEFVNEPDFASLPIEKQRTYLQKALTKADDTARKQFLDQMPDDQIEQRVQAYQGTKTTRPFAYVGSP